MIVPIVKKSLGSASVYCLPEQIAKSGLGVARRPDLIIFVAYHDQMS